jgi:hypothetical protein
MNVRLHFSSFCIHPEILGARRLGRGGSKAGAIPNDAYFQDAAPGHLGCERPPQVGNQASRFSVAKLTRSATASRSLIRPQDTRYTCRSASVG